ncbi:MAG: hypothetical protein Q9220_003779 [cf. Caloplaca sp. 1 TL-2023]
MSDDEDCAPDPYVPVKGSSQGNSKGTGPTSDDKRHPLAQSGQLKKPYQVVPSPKAGEGVSITVFPKTNDKEVSVHATTDSTLPISIVSKQILDILEIASRPKTNLLGVAYSKGQPYHLFGCVELRWRKIVYLQSHLVRFWVTDSTSCMVILGENANPEAVGYGQASLSDNLSSPDWKPTSKGLQYERRLSTVETEEGDNMELVRSQVVRTSTTWYPQRAFLTLDWDLLHFLENQFPYGPKAKIGSIITLSGLALYAQTTTCSKYVEDTWPLYGLEVLKIFEDTVDSVDHQFRGQISYLKDSWSS